MNVANVFTVTDIDSDQFTTECLAYLENHATPTYKDQVLKEDIYNISDIIEGIDNEDAELPPDSVRAELDEVESICADCSYFRIVYN